MFPLHICDKAFADFFISFHRRNARDCFIRQPVLLQKFTGNAEPLHAFEFIVQLLHGCTLVFLAVFSAQITTFFAIEFFFVETFKQASLPLKKEGKHSFYVELVYAPGRVSYVVSRNTTLYLWLVDAASAWFFGCRRRRRFALVETAKETLWILAAALWRGRLHRLRTITQKNATAWNLCSFFNAAFVDYAAGLVLG